MAAETIRSARSEARTNDLDGEGRRMMSTESVNLNEAPSGGCY
jgi:hypothetical protein